MKKILFTFILGMLVLSAFSQEKTLFLDNEPWEKVLKEAQKSKKMVFVDTYTQWCGPCKDLMNRILPQKEVSDYLRANFVCVRYDLEKDNGNTFRSLYPNRIIGIPTMLIIDAQGNLLHAIKGAGREGETLVNFIKEGLSGKPLYEIEKEYQQGKRDLEFVMKYFRALEDAYEKEKCEQIAREYAAQFPMDSLLNPDIWMMLGKYVVEQPYSEEYRFVVEHLDEFQKRGLDRFLLEQKLGESMGFAVNMLYIGAIQPDSKDSLPALQKKAMQLKPLLMYPVKGFSDALVEWSLNECVITGKVEKLCERLCVFVDCGLLRRDVYIIGMFEYVIKNTNNIQIIRACVDYLDVLREKITGYERDIINDVIVLGNSKLNKKNK